MKGMDLPNSLLNYQDNQYNLGIINYRSDPAEDSDKSAGWLILLNLLIYNLNKDKNNNFFTNLSIKIINL